MDPPKCITESLGGFMLKVTFFLGGRSEFSKSIESMGLVYLPFR